MKLTFEGNTIRCESQITGVEFAALELTQYGRSMAHMRVIQADGQESEVRASGWFRRGSDCVVANIGPGYVAPTLEIMMTFIKTQQRWAAGEDCAWD